MNLKYIYWFSYYNLNDPSVRYRGKYVLDELYKKNDIKYTIIYPGYDFKNISRFIKAFFSVIFFRKKDSLIVFQAIFRNGIYSNALKVILFFRKTNTLYDTDDADYTRFPPKTINYFIKKCEACSVGSKALSEYVQKYNSNIILLTSPVIAHDKIKKEKNQTFTIGWIGYYNAHKESLIQLLFPAIKDINFKLKLIIIGVVKEQHKKEIRSYFGNNKNVFIEIPENINWLDELSIYNIIKTFDVGISPLIDSELNRAKSAFKLKQYLSCGVPVLGSSIGENSSFIENGINGYICNTPEDYKNMILKINNLSANEYKFLSNNAIKSINKFSIENFCSTLIEFYKN